MSQVLSVLVAARAAAPWLTECVSSIVEQQLAAGWRLEILVGVDDCRSTLEVARGLRHEALRCFTFPQHSGTYVVFNTLSLHARGNALARFDADDVMLSGYLGRQLDLLLAEPSVSLTSTWSIYTDPWLRPASALLSGGKRTGTDGRRNGGSAGQFTMRREVWDRLGGFQPWRCFADSEFLTRARHAGFVRRDVEEHLYLRRVHPRALTVAPESGYESPERRQREDATERACRLFEEGVTPPRLIWEPVLHHLVEGVP